MAVRITPPGGRTRRKSGAVSLSSGDVPTVAPARDPGVNVPLIPIPVDGTAGAVGAGFQALGDVLGESTNLALQIVKRDEGLARDTDETSFSDTLQDTLRDLQATADLSDSAAVEAVGQQMIEEQQRILSEHKGGQTSKELLTNRLTRLRNSFADTLAVLNINAADVRLKQTVERRISSITQDVLTDPDVLVSSDPLEAFRFHAGQLEEEIEFLELRPDQARVVRQAGQSEIALTMITPLIKNGQFDRAKALLRDDEVAKVLSPGQQRDAVQRIIDAERKLAEAKNEGQEFLNTARTILGPTATDEDVRAAAAQMAGMEQDGGFKIVDVGGGKVIAVDEDTLEVSTIVSGPTIEEEAAREGAVERAKLLARKDILSGMAADAGLGELFAITPTGATDGGEGTPQPAQPISPKKEGEGDEPTGPEVVPPLPEEAVITPFGPEEDPASNDMQSVLGLMALSRRFFLIGDNASANGLLSQARMIIDNSREIQQQRELDKPITNVEILRELGLPLGATMRQGASRILPSTEQRQASRQQGEIISLAEARQAQVPVGSTRAVRDAILADRERRGGGSAVPRTFEKKAEAVSLASARGKEQSEAEVQMRFVFEADQQTEDLLEEIKDDPTLVATVGALRATGRKALTLLADLGFDNLVDAARNVANESDLTADEIFEFFDDPLLSALDLVSNSIGVKLARIRNPVGRVPVELIKRSIKDVDLTKFGGAQLIIDRLDRIRTDEFSRRRDVLKRQFPDMFDPFSDGEEGSGVSGGLTVPPDTPRFRFEGGKLVPVIPDEVLPDSSLETPDGRAQAAIDRLIALKPPTDPTTGLSMRLDTPQAAEFRTELDRVLAEFGSKANFEAALAGQEETPDEPLAEEGSSFPRLTGEIVGKTREGRPILLDEEGGVSTERTVTEKVGGKWTNIPTIFSGKEVTSQEAVEIIESNKGVDPDTDKKLKTFKTLEQAEEAAVQRSESLDEDLRREGLLSEEEEEEEQLEKEEKKEEGGPLENLLGPLFPSGLLSGKFKGLDDINSAILKGVDNTIETVSRTIGLQEFGNWLERMVGESKTNAGQAATLPTEKAFRALVVASSFLQWVRGGSFEDFEALNIEEPNLSDLSPPQLETVRKEINDWLSKDVDSGVLEKRLKSVTEKEVLTGASLDGILRTAVAAKKLLITAGGPKE